MSVKYAEKNNFRDFLGDVYRTVLLGHSLQQVQRFCVSNVDPVLVTMMMIKMKENVSLGLVLRSTFL